MTSPAAIELRDLLREVDAAVAEPAIGPLHRLVDETGLTPNLVVALVGPPGTRTSALFNVLAGAEIAAVGPIRPTTTDAEIWPIGSRGLILIDTPPFELDPDGVTHALDRTDLAVVVLTPERYADVIVRDLTMELERRGVPTVVALNRIPDDPALAAAITVDVIASLEGELTIVPESATGNIHGAMLRDRIAGLGRTEIVARRDLGAAVFVEDQVEMIAQQIEDHDVHVDELVDIAERNLADARIDRGRLAASARLSWPLASKMLLDTVATTTTRAMESVVKDPSLHPRVGAVARDAAEAAGPLDAAPLDAWKQEITDGAVARMRKPSFHPLQRRAVEQQMWRLAADLAMLPDRRIRSALGDQVADLRMAGNHSLTLALRDAAEHRIDQFMDALGSESPVSASQLRQAAGAVVSETTERVERLLSKSVESVDG